MRILLFTFLIVSFLGSAQKPIKVTISGNVFNSKLDSISISQFFGGANYKDFFKAPLSKKGDFVLKGTLPNPDYYVLRVGGSHVNLILRDSSDIKIYGDGSNIYAFCNIVGSDESKNMNDFIKQMTAWNFKRDSAMALIQKEPARQEEISNSMTAAYYSFQSQIPKILPSNR
ncbi:MAG: hypothetical protein LW688_10335 [Cryomorphaceae bacterium]|nr:hypothetical protein [Cryomorphaceae bacterium]